MTSRELWQALSGFVCVYKHAETSTSSLKRLLIKRLVAEATRAQGVPRLPQVRLPVVEPHPRTGALVTVGEKLMPDYRYHPHASGSFLRAEDIQLEDLNPLETSASGVCLIGMNESCEKLPELQAKSWVNVYRLDGILGKAGKSQENEGKTAKNMPYDHRGWRPIFGRPLFKLANVDMQSEEAFEIARKGLPRLQLPGAQMVYSIELPYFKAPFFTLTVQAAGEDWTSSKKVGLELDTVATCTRVQRRSLGPFVGEDTLLEKQFGLLNVVRNINYCREVLSMETTTSEVLETRLDRNSRLDRHAKRILDGIGLTPDPTDPEKYDSMRPVWGRHYS
ncbi:unnamed protein product [Caenorhabditis auriculariae]|uniref:Uncharacterized protein n=1 Tax=Caenorhabditis auriculariae TaxID=2777116 RepID=A0A8S1HIL8_9PELO|nr:unnamed protein product [Caenorhabditis auriculariae]